MEPWLITPVPNVLPRTPEERFNSAHSLGRCRVEMTHGCLKNIFRCLGDDRQLRYKPRVVGSIINSCAVLYNMRCYLRLPHPPAEDPAQRGQHEAQEQHAAVEMPLDADAQRIRQSLITRFM